MITKSGIVVISEKWISRVIENLCDFNNGKMEVDICY